MEFRPAENVRSVAWGEDSAADDGNLGCKPSQLQRQNVIPNRDIVPNNRLVTNQLLPLQVSAG